MNKKILTRLRITSPIEEIEEIEDNSEDSGDEFESTDDEYEDDQNDEYDPGGPFEIEQSRITSSFNRGEITFEEYLRQFTEHSLAGNRNR